jgi:hypothetical protein
LGRYASLLSPKCSRNSKGRNYGRSIVLVR